MKTINIVLVLTLILLVSCKKETLPVVETVNAHIKDATHATLQGQVLDEGSTDVETRGFCWALTPAPTVIDHFSLNGSGLGAFSEEILIVSDSIYYARAFATNEAGTIYGDEVSFSTTGTYTGSFTDLRDGNRYRWVKINGQTWMAENMAYLPSVSPAAEGELNDPFYYVQGYEGKSVSIAVLMPNYQKYGVLYNGNATQYACPSGWHLPFDTEWMILEEYLGMNSSDIEMTGDRTSGGVGKKMKSASGWFQDGNGNNSIGFNAMPGGTRNANGKFGSFGMRASFRTATAGGSTFNFSREFGFDSDGINRGSVNHSIGLSVRCIKDE
jgi:uncharacterized protein (TIGR02145 family)